MSTFRERSDNMKIALALKAHQTTRTAERIGNKLVTLLSVSLSLYTITFPLPVQGGLLLSIWMIPRPL